MLILHLENEPAESQRVVETMAAVGLKAELTRVDTREAFEAALRQAAERGGLDLILARYMLPELPGPQALALAQQWCPDVPFIFVALAVPQVSVIEALQRGATDYVIKEDLARLPAAVKRARREADERAARQRAEAEAAADRERLRVTLASIGDAVIATDRNAAITFMNPVAEQLTGWPLAEAAGQPVARVFDVISETSRQPVESPVARVLREGSAVGLANHTLLVRRDRSEVPIDDIGAPIFDQQGRPLGVVLIFRDISVRRAAEQALSDSEARFRNLVTTTSAVIWTAGPAGDFVTPQLSWEAYTGQPWEAHRGWGWAEMLHPDDRESVVTRWKAVVADPKPYETHSRLWNAKSQEYCYFESRAVPLLNPDGSVREWIGAVDDVHQRELARLGARESEARFRVLADTAPVLVWMAAPDGAVDFVNQTWLVFTGRSLEQELGEGWAADVHAEDFDRCQYTYRTAVNQRRPFQQEYRLRRADGEYRWVLDTGVPRFEADGRFAGFIGSIMDIHERKTYEENLRRRARQQAELASLGQRALAGLALPALCDQVAEVVTAALDADLCELLELLPGGQSLRLVGGVGWPPGLVGAASISTGANSMAGFTLLSDEPVVVADLPSETRFSPPTLLTQHGAVSGLTAIIRGEANPWGVLGVFTARRRDFNADDANFLQSVANVLADAIIRSRSEDALRVAHEQTAAILEGVAEGVSVQSPDGRLVFANDAAARLLGFANAEAMLAAQHQDILGQFDILDENGQPLALDRLPGRRALNGERDAEELVRYRVRATGEEHWAQDHAQPIYNRQGQVELAVSIFHDITELKQAEITQRLLAEAGELLTRDLDTQDLMQGLAQLPVPTLADYCIIYQLDADGEIRASVGAHANPQEMPALQELMAYRNPNPNPNDPVRQALLRKEPVLLAHIDPPADRQNLPEGMRHLLPHSLVLAPLVARERLSGVLLLARYVAPQAYNAADQALTQELARRAALVLDNSELYADSRRLNRELEVRVRDRTEALNLTLERLQQNNLALETEIRERQAAEDRFRGLLQAAPDATVIAEAKGAIVMVNQQAEAMFGYAAADLVGQKVELLLPKGLAVRHRAHRRTYIKEPRTRTMGQGLDLRARHRDGHEFPVEVSLSPLQTPEGWLIMASVRDITQRKQAEAALRQSERQLVQAQQIAQVGSWRWDLAADQLTWSDVLCQIHGLEPPVPAMSYREFLDHIHPDDRSRVNAILGAARRAGSSFEYEHRFVRADGAERSLYSRGEVLRDAAGEAMAITAITQDLTDRKQIEAELRASREQLRQLSGHLQATREEERTRMSREIHDELGGTLTGLKMDMARLAKNADTLTPDELRARAQNMSALIDATVQVVRRIASDLRPGILDDFGLDAAIEWQLQEFCTRAGLEFEYRPAENELDLDPASSTALFRLFQETLTNVARHAQATRVHVRLETQPGELVLEVRDNGRGITTAEIANARSLGLLGMRERVHLLNGQLSIQGAPDQGTTVLVRVPIAEDARPAAAPYQGPGE